MLTLSLSLSRLLVDPAYPVALYLRPPVLSHIGSIWLSEVYAKHLRILLNNLNIFCLFSSHLGVIYVMLNRGRILGIEDGYNPDPRSLGFLIKTDFWTMKPKDLLTLSRL